MYNQKDRDDFLIRMLQEGMTRATAMRMMCYATTLHRLADAQCNGDYPADNGERSVKTCAVCGMCWSPASFRSGMCPDCRTTALVRAAIPAGFTAIINGDPRGAVLKIVVPSGYTNDWGAVGVCVPSSRYIARTVPQRGTGTALRECSILQEPHHKRGIL